MERSSTLARKTQHKVKNGLRLAVTYLFLGLLGLVMVYPLLWMVASSFKENKGIFNSISIIPPSLSLEHYIEGWKGVGEYTFTTFFTNTFSIVIPSTVFIIVSCLLVAYGFARFEFPMKKFLFTAMMATLMLPSAVIIIPRYMLFKQFGWILTCPLSFRPCSQAIHFLFSSSFSFSAASRASWTKPLPSTAAAPSAHWSAS